MLVPSYVSGIPRPTLLAPDIVQAIPDGRQPAESQLETYFRGLCLIGRGSASNFRGRGRRTATERPGGSDVLIFGRFWKNLGPRGGSDG